MAEDLSALNVIKSTFKTFMSPSNCDHSARYLDKSKATWFQIQRVKKTLHNNKLHIGISFYNDTII